VHQPGRLLGYGKSDGRVGMPQVADRDTGHKIEVGSAGFVPELTAFTSCQYNRQPFVGRRNEGVGFLDGLAGHLSAPWAVSPVGPLAGYRFMSL
jgi:hypothetical protein